MATQVHAVFDTDSLARQRKAHAREKLRQRDIDNLNRLLQNSILLDKMDKDPTKATNQMGRVMLSSQLESIVRKLCPSLSFRDNTFIQSKAGIGYIDENGWHTVTVYEKGYMPERSILRSQEELVPDLSYEASNRPLDRKDMPKGKLDPVKGWTYDPGTVLPGWKKVRHPYGEAVRGWRTVLLQLIHHGFTTPTAVENILGPDNTAQWAAHTGKQSKKSLGTRW